MRATKKAPYEETSHEAPVGTPTVYPVKLDLPVAEILHVDICSQPRVVRQVPSWIVRVLVEHDVIVVPHPAVGIFEVIRRNAEVEAAEPEAVAAATFYAIDVIPANFPTEMSVLPGMIETVVRIIAASHVADPAIPFCVNVRRFRMAFLIAIGGARGLPTLACVAALGRCGYPRGSVSRDVAATDVRGSASMGLRATRRATCSGMLLCENWYRG